MIHTTADVNTTDIGKNTRIWQYSVILNGAKIGENCNINCHTFIESNVFIGNNVTVKSGVFLWNGIIVEDYVFIGPNVTFTNDYNPRSQQYKSAPITLLKKGSSIGAASTILPGITIGKYAMVGAGALVTKDVPDFALVYGTPASQFGWVNQEGLKMILLDANLKTWQCSIGNIYQEKDGKLFLTE